MSERAPIELCRGEMIGAAGGSEDDFLGLMGDGCVEEFGEFGAESEVEDNRTGMSGRERGR
jgi:hypothetical protein